MFSLNNKSTSLHRSLALTVVALSFSVSSCEKDDDDPQNTTPPGNEQELITELELLFVNPLAGDTLIYAFEDADGPGGNDPVIDDIVLQSGTVYQTFIKVFGNHSHDDDHDDHGTDDHGDDLTEEIAEEDEEHQFFFQLSNLPGLEVNYFDVDEDGNPIGLTTVWNATAPGSGNVLVTLRHELDKNAPGVAEGDIENAGGETDIEVSFQVVIQ